MSAAPPPGRRALVPFAALSATYFAHIGFFNPYLPLWLKSLGLPIVVISLLASVQSFTRVFAPYAWGALSDHTGERVKLLRWSAAVALLASLGLWWNGGTWWVGLVLLLMFTHTSSMMSLTEAAMAHLVAGDWGRYGRVRLWGSVGFMVTVFCAGAWFEHFGMGHFPGWTLVTLLAVLGCTLWLPSAHEQPVHGQKGSAPIGPVLRQPAVRWFFASLFFHVMAHYAIYGFFSLYLDARGYGKGTIGLLWAVSVVVEVAWFFGQGRWLPRLPLTRWLWICGLATVLRMVLTGWGAGSLVLLFLAQALHALTFATHHAALHRDGVDPLPRPPARPRPGPLHRDGLRPRGRGRGDRRRRARVALGLRIAVRRGRVAGPARHRGSASHGPAGAPCASTVMHLLRVVVAHESIAAR